MLPYITALRVAASKLLIHTDSTNFVKYRIVVRKAIIPVADNLNQML